MTRRLAYLLFTIFSCLGLSAQTNVGSGWKIHAVFGDEMQNIIDTGSKVYYLASGNLYSSGTDSDWEESEHYSKQVQLTSVDIQNIYYNYEKGYLAIAYEDSNIDILYDNGDIINIPDLYDADIADKGINDITFEGDKVYVATDFGFAILNGKKGFEVSESHNFGIKLSSIDEIGGYLWISTEQDLLHCKLSKSHRSFSDFTAMNNGAGGKIYKLSDSKFLFSNWGIQLVAATENTEPQLTWLEKLGTNHITILHRSASGFIGIDTATPHRLLSFDNEGNYTASTIDDADMQASLFSSLQTDGSLWEISPHGLRKIKFDNGNITVLSDYFRYNASSVRYPYYLRYNNSNYKLYVWNCGPNRYSKLYNTPARVNTLNSYMWIDITPSSAPTLGTYSENILKDPFSPVFDPEDPKTYYMGTFFEGVYKVTGNKVVAKYDWTNSPLKKSWECFASNIFFDQAKNLWMVQGITNPAIYVLPRAKQSKTDLTADDWITVKVELPEKTDQFMQGLITKKNIKVMCVNNVAKTLLVIDDNGTPASSSIKYKMYSPGELYDQDEKAFNWDQVTSMVEDANGRIWLGTNNGVIEFNPSNALNENFRINRIKVPRNDGTNLADYLLSGTEITALAVDGANRKWIGTASMGLYLVSADGSKILKHFSMSNSMLTSDRIVSLCCNPNSNSVYIGMPTGLVEYYSDAAPAADDYSDIYAYPNPVTPDYTGEITITGLMENSLVKIADAAGNVIRSLQSTGGMVTWDGCYNNGERVKTGVYYVLASQNENSKSSGVVTKILFIK